ncbi:MAG: hypothetical protein ACFE8J_07360 [Candidatus Heimdallarchaeota archaeon]
MARKLGIIGGLIAFILAVFSEIPIYPPERWVIDFKIFTLNDTEIYFWGYLINENISFSSIILQFPENILALTIWITIILIGLILIMASTKKANPANSKLLFKINNLLLIYLLTTFGVIILIQLLYDFTRIFSVIGLGFYLTLILLILNLFTLNSLKKD